MKKILLILFCMVLLVGTISAFDFDNIGRYNESSRTFTIKNSILGIPFLQLGTVAEIKLNSPDIVYVVRGKDRKFAELTINNYGSYLNAFKKMEFHDMKNNMKKFERDFTYRYKKSLGFETVNDYETVCGDKTSSNGTKYQDCHQKLTGTHQEEIFEWLELDASKELPTGKITIGIFIDVHAGDHVEWIPTLFGVKIDEWAEWTEGLDVDIISYYQLNRTSGAVIDELKINDGINIGADRGVIGKIENAFDFESTESDIVYVLAPTNMDNMATLTVNYWTKTESFAYMNTIRYNQDATGISVYAFFVIETGKYRCLFNTDGGSVSVDAISDNTNDWQMVTCQWNGTSANVYVNGTLENSVASGSGDIVDIGGANWTIGGQWDSSVSAFSSFYDGIIDEVGVWGRILSAGEITQLYNGGAGISYPLPSPTIFLNLPVDTYNSTSSTIIFNGTVYDILGNDIANVSLILNGIYNETNSSGINNTDYIFTKIISDGNHNWTYEACDVLGNCETEITRTFTINTTPNIQFENPTPVNEYNSSVNYFTTNVSLTETYFNNLTFYLYNSSGLYGSTTYTDSTRHINWTDLPDDKYSYNATVRTNTAQSNSTETRNITIDATAPEINITYPTAKVDHHLVNTNLTLNWTVLDSHLDSCWYNYNETNISVTCSDNHTNINITEYSNRNITFYANDTLEHLNSDYQEWNYSVFENFQTFNNETLEGNINTFTANVTIEESNPITIAYFIYNETSYIGSFSQSGEDFILTIDFSVLNVDVETDLTFFWSLQLLEGQIINLTSYNQTVSIISLDDCSVNTVVLYNYTIVDEANQSQLLNTTAELHINLLDIKRQIYISNFSVKYSDINPFAVCISKNLSSSIYVIDSIVKYEAIGYFIEYYNIVNATITNSTIPQNINLYDLSLADGTEFKITFKAEDFTFVENALIYIDRQYIAENNTFKTVELPKTDSAGQSVGHFVRNDIVYNIRVIKNGVVLGNFRNIIAFCEDYTIGKCQMILEATPVDIITFDYDEQLGIIFQSVPTYNENTSAVSFDFSTDDGSIKTVSMEVTRDDIFGNQSICNNTLTSSSGTLTCSFDPNIDDSVLRVSVFVDEQQVVLSNVKLETSSIYGNLGYVLWFFLTFLFILLFGHSKTEILIGLAVGFIGAISLGITRGNIIGIGSAGIWVLVIVILGIYKLNKEKPQ